MIKTQPTKKERLRFYVETAFLGNRNSSYDS